ncbi:MAG: transporter substrate-binding domain-containing protein [Alphaproteobacteria bacterium]|nr:transporter substrate-binding domain-containing protein [Alphaproteobacteria bacterium]
MNAAARAPFTTPEGTGILDYMISEAFGKLDRKAKIHHLPPERALRNANEGIDDGDAFRVKGIEEEYPNLIRVDAPYSGMDFVGFALDPGVSFQGWKGLENYRVGYIRGWKVFEARVTDRTDRIVAETPDQLFTLLEKGRIDVALFNRWMGVVYANSRDVHDLRIVEPSLAKLNLYVYLHKKHEEIVAPLTRALQCLIDNGYRKTVYDRVLRPIHEQFVARGGISTWTGF